MNTQKQFPIEQVISVTHRVLLTREVNKIPELLSWFVGESVFTHQWTQCAAQATPAIMEQHPFLALISLARVTPANYAVEVGKIRHQYGDSVMLTRSVDAW